MDRLRRQSNPPIHSLVVLPLENLQKLCRLVWKILHRGIRYEERGPEVSKASKQKRTRKMIQALRSLGYRIEPAPSQSTIPA